MKLFALVAAAGLAFVAPAASASAAPAKAPIAAATATAPAQTHVRISVGDQRHYQRHYQRRGHHWRRNHMRHASWRRVCTTHWRHHHRVRTCRNVRYWR
jgi:hypothetical protein